MYPMQSLGRSGRSAAKVVGGAAPRSAVDTVRLLTLAVALACALPGLSRAAADEIVALTIDEAVSLAVDTSTEVRVAGFEVEKSTEAIREARARRGPRATIQGSGSYLSNPPEGIAIEKGALGYAPTFDSPLPTAIPDRDFVLLDPAEHTYFTLKAAVTQPLFTSGKLHQAQEIARVDREASYAELEAKERDVAIEVQQLYLAAKLAELSVPILEEIAGIAATIVEDRNRSFDEGFITRQEVLEALSDRARLELELGKTREALATSREALAWMTGLSEGKVSFVSEFRDELPELDEADLVEAARENSSDLAVLDARVAQAIAAERIAAASRPLLPDLSLTVTLDVTGQRIPIIGANWSDSWDANLIVSVGTQVTLFDSGAARSGTKKAGYDVESARAGRQAVDESVPLLVRRAVEAVRTAYFELEYSRSKSELASERLKNARVSFENELITRVEYSGAELGSLLSELETRAAEYTFDTALVSLEALTGLTIASRR
jgi:outer membrane protein